jgi:hypothetical protein
VPFFGDSEELFFKALFSKSEKIKRFVLQNFMTKGRNRFIELPYMIPIKSEEHFRILQHDAFTRDETFLKKLVAGFPRSENRVEKRSRVPHISVQHKPRYPLQFYH